MKKLHKRTERNTREQQHAMAVLGGVEFRWEWKGKGEYARKCWYLTMPSWHKPGYISGPYSTKWEAVERALTHLGVGTGEAENLPDEAVGYLSPTGRIQYALGMGYGRSTLPDSTVWEEQRVHDEIFLNELPPR